MTCTFGRAFVFAALLAFMPTLAQAQIMQQRRAPDAEKKFVVFIHAGPLAPTHEVVKGVAIELAKAGYLVRAPDGDVDAVGGPGVDYFDADAKMKAEEIAKMVNAELAKSGVRNNRPLAARRKTSKTPPEYFGVWLFDKAVDIPPAAPPSAAITR